jgi:hypothetical protein
MTRIFLLNHTPNRRSSVFVLVSFAWLACAQIVGIERLPVDSTPVADSAQPDASDVGTIFDAVVKDAIADTGLGFCAANPGHSVCDDFDGRLALGPPWTGDPKVEISSERAESAPNALRVLLSVDGGNYVNSQRPLTSGIGADYTLSFSLYIDPLNTEKGAFSIGSVYMKGMDLGFSYYGQTSVLRITETIKTIDGGIPDGGEPSYYYDLSTIVPKAIWTRVELHINKGRLTASVNNNSGLDVALHSVYSGTPTVSFGIYSLKDQRVFYDNLLFDAR